MCGIALLAQSYLKSAKSRRCSALKIRDSCACNRLDESLLCPERIGFQRLFQRVMEGAEFVEGRALLVRRLSGFGRSDPFSDGVSRQPGTLGYLVQRELVAEVHPPDFPQHFHADHLVFSCSKSEQKQLNTRVSFQSAKQPLLGQISVSGNTSMHRNAEGTFQERPMRESP